jgi:hypothetical protein
MLLYTDQTTCYDIDGREIPCRGTGQDGERTDGGIGLKKRFVGDEHTVLDRLTDLTWCRDAGLSEFPLTWQEAHDFVDRMNREHRFGCRDWRLPSREDLFGLVSHVCINPSLPLQHPFRNVFPAYYWSGTSCARLPDQAWYIHFGGGRVYRGMKQGSYMLWPARGGVGTVTHHAPRFALQRETVLDRLTGLMWTRSPNGTAGAVDWQEALEAARAIKELRVGGHADWRLPNIRELTSLVDLEQHSPALPPDHPFDSVQEGYWSSTTSVYEPRYAWALYTLDGAVGVGYKARANFHVWGVRTVV